MNVFRRAKKIAAVLVVSALAACQSLGPHRVIDDSTTEEIAQLLDEAQKMAGEQQGQLPPKSITDGLLPPLLGNTTNDQVEARFDVGVDNVQAQAFFLGLVKDTEYNIVVHPEVAGSITLNLTRVSVPEVVDIVSTIYGYPVRRQGSLFTVLPAGIRTEVFKINYLDIQRQGNSQTRVASGSVSDAGSTGTSNTSRSNSVDNQNPNSGTQSGSLVGTYISTTAESDFWGQLQQNLELMIDQDEDKKVIVNPQTGVVIVRALPGEIAIISDYLQSSELIMKRQVILEAKILEVTLSDEFQAGINWAAIHDAGNNKSVTVAQGGAAFPGINGASIAQIPGASGIPAANTSNGIFGVTIDLNDFAGIIDLLESQGTVQVLSSPRISTVNNQKAVIKVGTDNFFVTEVTNTVTTSNGSSTNTPSIELTPFFSGIALDVTPQISDSDEIVLHVHPTVSEVSEQNRSLVVGDSAFSLPLAQSSIRESDSIISARSEQVVVIGGLIQSVSTDNDAATPWVSKVPLLGHAFRQKAQRTLKRELVILLKPSVLNSSANAESIAGSLQRFRNLQSVIK